MTQHVRSLTLQKSLKMLHLARPAVSYLLLKVIQSPQTDPVHGFVGVQCAHLRVLLQAGDEVQDRLAPPVRHEPLRLLGRCARGRNKLHVAALLLRRRRLDDVFRDVVQIDSVLVERLSFPVEPRLPVRVVEEAVLVGVPVDESNQLL